MQKIKLGKTGLTVSRTAFGAIPIQRISEDETRTLLRKAYEGGINFYDTARMYGVSEGRIGRHLGDVRSDIIIATKTGAKDAEQFEKDLATSLTELGEGSYIDIYQFHNPPFVPRPGGADGMYDAMLKARDEGKIRHIGISNHSVDVAKEAVESGLFETLQFPLSHIATDEEVQLVELCEQHNVGFIAMKGMAGGLITNAKPAFAFLRQFENVIPIWGIEHMWQLEEFLGYEANPPLLDDELWAVIKKDRNELAGGFCRACGYCLPCPTQIHIPQAARMKLLLGRTAVEGLINERGQEMMGKIKGCIDCGHCIKNCPYKLDTPTLLRDNLRFFEEFLASRPST
ncbi:MAG: aldo/keto reductase [Defluviitaleaceae bacterium]|nr:aldo/keto reductase [Defluviitaleaceae bacterium]